MRNRVAALLVGIIAAGGFLQAQVTSRLTGSVVDPSNAAVPGAKIDIFVPGGTNPIISSVTTADGLFAFTSLPVGSYDVVVTAAGFRKATQREVQLEAGKELALGTIKMELGNTTETVEVKENALAVQTSNSEIASTVSRSQVHDLPILNRSPPRVRLYAARREHRPQRRYRC